MYTVAGSSCCYTAPLSCYRYGDLRLLSVPELRRLMPMTMPELERHITDSCLGAAETLLNHWLPEAANLVDGHRDLIEECMPSDNVVCYSLLLKCVLDFSLIIEY